MQETTYSNSIERSAVTNYEHRRLNDEWEQIQNSSRMYDLNSVNFSNVTEVTKSPYFYPSEIN